MFNFKLRFIINVFCDVNTNENIFAFNIVAIIHIVIQIKIEKQQPSTVLLCFFFSFVKSKIPRHSSLQIFHICFLVVLQMDLGEVRYNGGTLTPQNIGILHQQQLEQLQQQQYQQQLTVEQQKQVQTNQNRRRIRKVKIAQTGPTESGQSGEEKATGEKRPPKKKQIDENVSIEEALKALTMTPEGACNAMKTPVSVLQELLSRRGITPTYDLVQIEGAIHEPTFRYRVTYGNKDGTLSYHACTHFTIYNKLMKLFFVLFLAMGAGKSKKEAKHQAARNLIDKLTGVQIADQILPPASNANGNKE